MSIVKLTHRPWYVMLAPFYVWLAASITVGFLIYVLFPVPLTMLLPVLPLPLAIILISVIAVFSGLAGELSTQSLRRWMKTRLYPVGLHSFYRVRPYKLLMEDGHVVGFTCYRIVHCDCCGKQFRFIPVTEDELLFLLRENFIERIGRESNDPLLLSREMFANELKLYGIRLKTEYTTLFRQFYSLEYDSSKRTLIFYRPPRELEKMLRIRRAWVQILDKADRGDENKLIYLIAVKIRLASSVDNSPYFRIMSTCLLGIMKVNGMVWLHQTPHTLPLKLGNHLAWIMGVDERYRVVEADRAGDVWRPPRQPPIRR
ncbi:MAG: hypothetical protein QW279_05020 [Candidatus Jordarchaeaceae archaeon]